MKAVSPAAFHSSGDLVICSVPARRRSGMSGLLKRRSSTSEGWSTETTGEVILSTAHLEGEVEASSYCSLHPRFADNTVP